MAPCFLVWHIFISQHVWDTYGQSDFIKLYGDLEWTFIDCKDNEH